MGGELAAAGDFFFFFFLSFVAIGFVSPNCALSPAELGCVAKTNEEHMHPTQAAETCA